MSIYVLQRCGCYEVFLVCYVSRRQKLFQKTDSKNCVKFINKKHIEYLSKKIIMNSKVDYTFKIIKYISNKRMQVVPLLSLLHYS